MAIDCTVYAAIITYHLTETKHNYFFNNTVYTKSIWSNVKIGIKALKICP